MSYLLSSSNHNGGVDTILQCVLCLIFFHHQTTTSKHIDRVKHDCVLSSFIIKPQRMLSSHTLATIVSYLLSSSNHNNSQSDLNQEEIVSYLLSSSNHNQALVQQPQDVIVSYLLSSSNHNRMVCTCPQAGLCLIFFHHQTTTVPAPYESMADCVLSSFIIKPQPSLHRACTELLCLIFFHHQTTTNGSELKFHVVLCLIFFHHQTTTLNDMSYRLPELCLIFFHHQTTTRRGPKVARG